MGNTIPEGSGLQFNSNKSLSTIQVMKAFKGSLKGLREPYSNC